ncbi:MAG: family 31 glucosidase [Clostridia bacterium]|jgi:alpha-D-xyloside xylohydrolase|nr:family 31 glucosidase [Clostridia bacterium]
MNRLFKMDNGKLLWEYDSEKVRIEAWGENGLRVRVTKNMAFDETQNWALLNADQNLMIPEIHIHDTNAVIRNGKIKAVVSNNGKITFFNQKDEVLLEEYMRTRVLEDFKEETTIGENLNPEFCSALMVTAREFKPILGGDYALTMRFESHKDEKLYGMGQYQQEFLNLKGCTLELAQRNSQASVPFLMSNVGYGFLWNNPAIGEVNFSKNVTQWKAHTTKELDYWITAGDTPDEIEQAYASVTGKVPMMPDYAMGFWQCKLRYRTQEELLNVAREYKKRNLPLSVIVIDYFHWTNQGDWKFDKEYWPDVEGMVEELKEMGIELMVSIWPTVEARSENYQEMIQKGLLIRTERGIRPQFLYKGNSAIIDATNPHTREYVWSKVKKNYYDKGIKTFWLDEAEPEYEAYDFDNYRYYLGPNVQIGNIYPSKYAQMLYEGMEKEGQENIINLLRCAWAGSQRYGALVWSGDIHSSFRSMRNQLAAGLNMGIAGIPWWTTDIGGFHGGDPNDESFRECFVRWFEYATFCPVMRLHGFREPITPPVAPDKLGGGLCETGADNEIWSYGEEAYPILTKFLLLRERMKPYIKEQMKKAHEKGIPPMRPLFYDFPEDKKAWEIEDEYLFGSGILVAPVLYEGAASRKVYLPTGAKWTHAFTKETFEGGSSIECKTTLDTIPVFIKDDSEFLGIF